jgi:hypothetical protein
MTMSEQYVHVTTAAAVRTYEESAPIFEGLLKEVRGLSKKKPDATMSPGKVKMINSVLADLLAILKDEPAGKYLDVLNDAVLPQVSDAVFAMVQFETALQSFESRYRKYARGNQYWITSEQLAEWETEADEAEDEQRDDDEEDDEEDEDEDEDEE